MTQMNAVPAATSAEFEARRAAIRTEIQAAEPVRVRTVVTGSGAIGRIEIHQPAKPVAPMRRAYDPFMPLEAKAAKPAPSASKPSRPANWEPGYRVSRFERPKPGAAGGGLSRFTDQAKAAERAAARKARDAELAKARAEAMRAEAKARAEAAKKKAEAKAAAGNNKKGGKGGGEKGGKGKK